MSKKFDLVKQTIVDFEVGKYPTTAEGMSHLDMPTRPMPTALGDVPQGRTTLNLAELWDAQPAAGRQAPTPAMPPPPPPYPTPTTTAVPAEAELEPPPYTSSATGFDPALVFDFDTSPDTSHEPIIVQTPRSPLPNPALAAGRAEEAAALHVRATTPKPKREDGKVLMNFLIEEDIKKLFFRTCQDRGATPSIILRNMIKTYCGYCLPFVLLVLLIVSPAAAQMKPDSACTTAQILSYLQRKAFGGWSSVPNIKGTIGARHALWQDGATDPISDFVYSDYSNTRLEAKIEIPIFDLSYLRNRDKEKLEHRAFVMKSLSRILAAQRSVKTLEVRIGTVSARRDYVQTQINLKLANRSDLFPIEDAYYSLQAQLHEAQSTLEQRVIELAVLAENDWLEAYAMIIRWDGVLFDKIEKGGKAKK